MLSEPGLSRDPTRADAEARLLRVVLALAVSGRDPVVALCAGLITEQLRAGTIRLFEGDLDAMDVDDKDKQLPISQINVLQSYTPQPLSDAEKLALTSAVPVPERNAQRKQLTWKEAETSVDPRLVFFAHVLEKGVLRAPEGRKKKPCALVDFGVATEQNWFETARKAVWSDISTARKARKQTIWDRIASRRDRLSPQTPNPQLRELQPPPPPHQTQGSRATTRQKTAVERKTARRSRKGALRRGGA